MPVHLPHGDLELDIAGITPDCRPLRGFPPSQEVTRLWYLDGLGAAGTAISLLGVLPKFNKKESTSSSQLLFWPGIIPASTIVCQQINTDT